MQSARVEQRETEASRARSIFGIDEFTLPEPSMQDPTSRTVRPSRALQRIVPYASAASSASPSRM